MVRPRTEEVADIDRDSGADGPLSCLRSRVDPGRNRGRAAATGPVIANGVRRGRGRGKGRGRGGQGAGELQRDQRQQSSRRTVPSLVVPVVSVVGGRPFGRGTFSMPPRVTRPTGGPLGACLGAPALPVPVVGPIHVSQSPIDRGQVKPNVTIDHLAFYAIYKVSHAGTTRLPPGERPHRIKFMVAMSDDPMILPSSDPRRSHPQMQHRHGNQVQR